ncbi:MAG: hypothetical protein WC389_00375 [Lutibacter sp.]|jgi:hypothetical protein
MTDKEINEFIQDNSPENLKDFFKILIDKLNTTNKRNDKLSLIMGLLIVAYFIIDKNIVSNISLGPISINDVSLTKLFIPLIFAFVLLVFATLNAHRAVLLKNIKKIGKVHYNLKETPLEDPYYSNSFLRLIMPFSYLEELNSKYINNGKYSWPAFFMILPLFPLILSPFIFEFYAVKTMILNNWENGILEKIVIILTVWIITTSIIYYVKLLSSTIKENKE